MTATCTGFIMKSCLQSPVFLSGMPPTFLALLPYSPVLCQPPIRWAPLCQQRAATSQCLTAYTLAWCVCVCWLCSTLFTSLGSSHIISSQFKA
jgi:hypothetical protein